MENHSGNHSTSSITGKWSVGRCGHMAGSFTDGVCCISRFGIILASYNGILLVLFRNEEKAKEKNSAVRKADNRKYSCSMCTDCMYLGICNDYRNQGNHR